MEAFKKEGLEEGLQRGIEKGKMITDLIRVGILTISEAARRLAISENQFRDLL